MVRTRTKSPRGRTAVIEAVKRGGPVTAEALALELGITGMAVRQHLERLEQSGLVHHELCGGARGRPPKLWRATKKAEAYFPDAHSTLATDLIAQAQRAFGKEGLERLVTLRTAEQQRAYSPRVTAKNTLKARLDALARIRSEEGYMAEVRREPETDAWLLLEHHCPICAAARVCSGLCR